MRPDVPCSRAALLRVGDRLALFLKFVSNEKLSQSTSPALRTKGSHSLGPSTVFLVSLRRASGGISLQTPPPVPRLGPFGKTFAAAASPPSNAASRLSFDEIGYVESPS